MLFISNFHTKKFLGIERKRKKVHENNGSEI